jgi:hypothetical protein
VEYARPLHAFRGTFADIPFHRARRVKCDEGKPYCARCVKFGVECDGYALPNKTPIPPPTSRVLLPRTYSQLRPLPTLRMYRLNTSPLFADEQEGRYFTIYCNEMAQQLRGPFPTSLWDRLIPQTSEAEPFIRHAIIGIGALSKINQNIKSARLLGNLSTVTPNYSYALEQYGKAIRGFRNMISRGERDIKKVLIACILVFCFETLHARPGTAVANATSGLMLLLQWMQANATQSVEFFLGSEWREQSIDEDLMTALAGLDLQVLFFLDTRPESVHQFMIEGANKIIPHMPPQFTSLRAARNFWSLIMRRNFHFVKIALTRAKAHEMAGYWKYGTEAPWEDCANLFPGGNMFSTPKEPAIELIPESIRYREDIDRWSTACKGLFEKIDESGRKDEKITVALLKMHAIISHIFLASAFFTSETQYDMFIPEFRSIMSLLEYTHPYLTTSGSSLYQFDLGIIIGMHMLGCRCRERETRDKAVKMMYSKQFREGFWDTGTASIFIGTVRDIEEENRDENGDLPDHKRVFVTCAFVDLAGRRGILGLVKRGLEGLEYLEKRYQY